MKLAELLTGGRQVTGGEHISQNPSLTASVNRQIQSLVPGQTIQGEVLSKNGSEVQIRLTDDVLIQARLEQSMNLEIGSNLFFQVKNNGQVLTLSPLFTNTAMQDNLMKALDMAGLPANHVSVEMTRQLMEAGLPIDRTTLQQVYREINQYNQGEVADMVLLHKMGLPVTEENVTQMSSYRNLSYQLDAGVDSMLQSIHQLVSNLAENGQTEQINTLLQQLLSFLPQEGESSATNVGNPVSGENVTGEHPEMITETETNSSANEAGGLKAGVTGTEEPKTGAVLDDNAQTGAIGDKGAKTAVIVNGNVVEENNADEMGMKQTQNMKQLLESTLDQLKQQWSLKPEDVANQEKVTDFYGKLGRQLRALSQTLEESNQTGSTVYKAVTNLQQNLDFLQQVNQMYSYVQLPLRLQQGNAHGDLYVYTNKKHMADSDGKVSALLHLDMKYLGPVDVYVTLQQSKVNTKFYMKDDDMLDFMLEHMDMLTGRLTGRGYQCTYEMQVKNQEELQDKGIGGLWEKQPEQAVRLAEYSFDMRA